MTRYWLQRYNWNIVERGTKHHKPNPPYFDKNYFLSKFDSLTILTTAKCIKQLNRLLSNLK